MRRKVSKITGNFTLIVANLNHPRRNSFNFLQCISQNAEVEGIDIHSYIHLDLLENKKNKKGEVETYVMGELVAKSPAEYATIKQFLIMSVKRLAINCPAQVHIISNFVKVEYEGNLDEVFSSKKKFYLSNVFKRKISYR